ncbi:MAG: Crp/Fnr family transcriptional regulator [Betaproteobacteria bacterium]|nr:Crp/Fnr family transcriptional regulator [Betaproteobacteria bacterium]
MLTLAQFLADSVWPRALEPRALERVQAEIVERKVPSGGYVCRKGAPVEYWVGVIEGLVKIASVSPQGKSVTFTGVRAGGWFGEGSLLRPDPWRYDAVALRESRVALLPRATFEWLLATAIGFNRFLLEQLNERLAQFIAMLEYDRLLEPDARVARCLAALFNPRLYPGAGRELAISQEELGYLSGVSRQRANQALARLAEAGLLRVEYGKVTVLDLEGLKRFEG